MEKKTCKKCKIEKSINDYFKDSNGKKGIKSKCKECCMLYNYSNINKKEYAKKYYVDHKKKEITRSREENGFLRSIPKEDFIRTCNEANNMREASRWLKITSFTVFKNQAIEYGCYNTNQGAKGTKKNKGWEKEVHEYKTRSGIRGRIIKENLLPYKCQECGLEEYWNGKKIVLHLDHINGVNNDHKIENLRFLCPNCHSQTSTYTGRNSYK
jgi:hypothetical protein